MEISKNSTRLDSNLALKIGLGIKGCIFTQILAKYNTDDRSIVDKVLQTCIKETLDLASIPTLGITLLFSYNTEVGSSSVFIEKQFCNNI